MSLLDKIRMFIAAHPIFSLFWSGIWGAIVIDLTAFAQSADPQNYLGSFNVKKHLLRWLQSGIGTALGISIAVGGGALLGLALYFLWRW